MVSPRVRKQLTAFAVVTVVAVGVLVISYLRVPAQLGMGRYEVSALLPNASGLFEGAPVTYRGREIGKVRHVNLRSGGVDAVFSIKDEFKVPSGSEVQVSGASVIGEPYVNLVYERGSREPLRDGARLPAGRVSYPVSTAQLLDSANTFLKSVPRKALRTTIHELHQGTQSTGMDTSKLLTSSFALQESATANLPATLRLIDRLGPVLKTQYAQRRQIQAWATNFAAVTGSVARADAAVRTLLREAAPTASQVIALMAAVRDTLPQFLTRVLQTSAVASVYRPALEHILIMLPALIEANTSVRPRNRPPDAYITAGLSFKMGFNDPPPCTTGFPDAGKHRAPEDESPAPLPKDSYCKVAKDDPSVVRGARNMPCPQDPSRTGATAELCGLVFNRRELKELR